MSFTRSVRYYIQTSIQVISNYGRVSDLALFKSFLYLQFYFTCICNTLRKITTYLQHLISKFLLLSSSALVTSS